MEAQAWDRSPVVDMFDTTLFSCHVGLVKPEPEIYNMAMRNLNVQAQDSIFVGDGGSNELKGARNCGLTTVMITGIIKEIWPDKIEARKKDADFVIENISELT